MSIKERQRLVVLNRVKRKEEGLTLVEAAELMRVSYRQAKRLWRRYRLRGDAGLVHGLRGRPSNGGSRRQEDRERALGLYQQKYGDFGPTLAAQCLQEREHLAVDHETLRRWLIAAGHWRVRHDRSREHRQWRERRHQAGQMVQMDGSDHPWFEARGPRCVLMVLVDDATNWTWGCLAASETTEAAWTALGAYVRQRGLPQSLYVDRDSIYVVNRPATAAENLQNTGPRTQFARAMGQLDVRIILAYSPQAKGRVERTNGTLQDRLVKMLRLEGLQDIPAANAYLERTFWPEHNARFALKALLPQDAHRPAPTPSQLDQVLCLQEERTVANDYCVRWEGRFFQLLATDANRGLARQKITLRRHLDGRIELLARGRALHYRELTQRPAPTPPPRPTLVQRLAGQRGPGLPGAAHPWRQPVLPAAAAAAGGPLRSGRTRYARPPCATGATRGKGTLLLEFK